MAVSGVNCGYIWSASWAKDSNQHVQHDQPVYILVHRVFLWWRLQRLAVPHERYGEQSEPSLKRKRLSQQRKESEPPFSVANLADLARLALFPSQ